jgi:hypothetical protein
MGLIEPAFMLIQCGHSYEYTIHGANVKPGAKSAVHLAGAFESEQMKISS